MLGNRLAYGRMRLQSFVVIEGSVSLHSRDGHLPFAGVNEGQQVLPGDSPLAARSCYFGQIDIIFRADSGDDRTDEGAACRLLERRRLFCYPRTGRLRCGSGGS